MPEAPARLLQCAHCHALFVLCSRCFRGQRYCSAACRNAMRQQSLRRAGRRYQRSQRGRFQHTRRQQRYRTRGGSNVTHHPWTSEADACTPGPADPTPTPGAEVQRVEASDAHRPCDADRQGLPEPVRTLDRSSLHSLDKTRRCARCGRLCGPYFRLPSRALPPRKPRPAPD